jgi:hypothetical protein
MTGWFSRLATLLAAAVAVLFGTALPASGSHPCDGYLVCPHTANGGVDVYGTDSRVAGIAGQGDSAVVDYAWRLRTLCMLSDEATGDCSPFDFRDCPQVLDRVIGYFVVQYRPVVRADGTAIGEDVLIGTPPGTLVGEWTNLNAGACLDITALNPPPSPGGWC